MKTTLLGALVASLLFVGVAATAGGQTGEVPTHRIATEASIPGCPHGLHSVKEYRRYASRVYKRKSVSKGAHRRLARMERCQHSAWAKRTTKRYHRRFKREREARAEIRALTPFSCSFGRFAIPCYIVQCESTDGSWDTINSIGAIGPYQFLGKRIVWPVRTAADRAAHHRLARSLWAGGSGAHHWAQCL